MLHLIFPESAQIILFAGILLGFILTLLFLIVFQNKLPRDAGRAFAVNGALSAGKPRGAGIIFILSFVLLALLFLPLSIESSIYYGMLVLAMLTGYFDDKAEKPWSEYKKAILDFLIALVCGITYVSFHSSPLTIGFFHSSFEIPAVLYVILAIILIWVSINVTNCTDGVDGLSGSIAVVTMGSFFLYSFIHGIANSSYSILLFITCLLAYLMLNASPSKLLMGDAGSRAIGLFIALLAMQSGHPLLFLAFSLVFLIDGGLGLIKVSLLRFLKISILKNTRTPIHDHVRKNKGWSDTQTVFCFVILQIILSACILPW